MANSGARLQARSLRAYPMGFVASEKERAGMWKLGRIMAIAAIAATVAGCGTASAASKPAVTPTHTTAALPESYYYAAGKLAGLNFAIGYITTNGTNALDCNLEQPAGPPAGTPAGVDSTEYQAGWLAGCVAGEG